VEVEKEYRRVFPLSPCPELSSHWVSVNADADSLTPHLKGYRAGSRWQSDPVSKKQLKLIRLFGFDAYRELTKGEASSLINQCKQIEDGYLVPATEDQEMMLRRIGEWEEGMSKVRAQRIIGRFMRDAA
jgi:hypothetical protein